MIFTSSSFFIQSKFQFVASFEFQTKFKSFKSEKFAINFNSNSISIKSKFENVLVQSNVLLVANSNSISILKNSKLISSRSISFKSTSTKSCFESIIKSNAVLEFDAKKTIIKAKTIVVVENVVKQIVIETIKSKITNVKNINFFDFTMQINL